MQTRHDTNKLTSNNLGRFLVPTHPALSSPTSQAREPADPPDPSYRSQTDPSTSILGKVCHASPPVPRSTPSFSHRPTERKHLHLLDHCNHRSGNRHSPCILQQAPKITGSSSCGIFWPRPPCSPI
ncbi:hypothetical protein LX32DRAFT_203913 [Colletotrichum zoysiae]|uniref:Uncharacterized protein n=1 Tax=Colletotrichum zoysiae TaxID=1216348 RepID=A0AAD9LV30_9PEZI|nr:hypothetical protein LX32DRAFT_203913 [Colletotrichum zoysiae]